MISLDEYEKRLSHLEDDARLFLNEQEYQEYCLIPQHERSRQLHDLLQRPVARFTAVNDVFFRARWAEVLSTVQPASSLTLLEIASGDADMIPQTMARVCPNSRYITANMNRILTARLREKTVDLPLEVVVIEEDAAEIERFLPPESVDLVAFQHAVNDVIQAVLCDREGIDTIYSDWMETLPKMIAILQRETGENTLEQHVKPAFVSLLKKLSQVLKKGGLIVMSHYMFQLDLDWGYPPALWEGMIPLARQWTSSLPGCREIFLKGFHPQWWMFLQKE
jgi:hypothetical protein